MTKPLRLMSIVGARPNFMKVAPLIDAMAPYGDTVVHQLVHTGQHYDEQMSKAFFTDLGMPRPDENLGVGSGTHAQQTARVMMAIEPVLADYRPDVLIVVGDVNSTIACALTAKKLGIRVAHVEAGLRSFDMAMPEEINRLCTDAISDILFTTDRFADANLLREGVDPARIHRVGNVMIDSMLRHLDRARRAGYSRSLGLTPGSYATLTLHRPANVDQREKLGEILAAIREGLPNLPIVFPAHPRTRANLATFGFSELCTDHLSESGIYVLEPLGYLDFLDLCAGSRLVLTDSGGLQEETTILGVPCVTLRENTERPITIEEGTNRLAGTSASGIVAALRAIAAGRPNKQPGRPEKWDGQAGERIIEILMRAGKALA